MKQKLLRPSVVWLTTIFFLVLQISCVNRGRLPPPENVREKLGKIGVSSAHFEPEYLLPERVGGRSEEALETAGEFTREAARGGPFQYMGDDPVSACLGFLVWLITLPFFACAGCIVGAVKAEPAKELDADSAVALREVFEQVNIQQVMRDSILGTATEKTNYTFVNLDERGPSSPDQEVDYAPVSDQGIATVLEISVLDVGLVSSSGIYPNFMFFMSLQTRLIRTADGEEVYNAIVPYHGEMHKDSLWAAENAKLFRAALRTGSEKLSGEVIELLFVRSTR
jgi:hypothetical protein